MTHQSPALASGRTGRRAWPRPAGRPGPAPRHWTVDACAALAGLGFGVAVGSAIVTETHGTLSAPGGLATAAGRWPASPAATCY